MEKRDVPRMPKPEAPSFAAFVTNLSGGETEAELSEALMDLIARVHAAEKAGSITLKITVEPLQGGGQVMVKDSIRVSLPDPDRAASVYFVDPTGRLSRNDPMQDALFGRDRAPSFVDPVTGEVT